MLETAKAEATAARRPDLEARILGLEGNVRARMGEGASAIELVRSGLTHALDQNLSGAAAEVYQRLADSLEHAGDYRGARETYDEASGFCAANELEPTAQLCLACLSVVLRHTGDWDHSAGVCRQVLDSPEATLHAKAAASGTLGLILALRGQRRQARPLLLESATVARRIELAAMELFSGWGLAVLEQARAPDGVAGRCRAILDRWSETEECHYAISPLRWSTTALAEAQADGAVRACTAALAQIAADSGQDEAMSALAHALGERVERRLGRLAAAELANGGLTRREVEVVRLVAGGQTNREIARELFLSSRTVDTHVQNIRMKLGCRSRADAARRASELGLVASPPTA
jgi:DNA-binding NarL/FixJ family response regulator